MMFDRPMTPSWAFLCGAFTAEVFESMIRLDIYCMWLAIWLVVLTAAASRLPIRFSDQLDELDRQACLDTALGAQFDPDVDDEGPDCTAGHHQPWCRYSQERKQETS